MDCFGDDILSQGEYLILLGKWVGFRKISSREGKLRMDLEKGISKKNIGVEIDADAKRTRA